MSDTTERLARLRAELASIVAYINEREARGKRADEAHDERGRMEAAIRELTEAHTRSVRSAYDAVRAALESATTNGRRTDCLNAAYEALRGALRHVEWEDAGRPDGERS